MLRKKYLFIVIFFLTIFLTLNIKLTQVPNGINGDEASIGYNAILVNNTLRDENKRLLPLFILTLDKKDWKQPITFYSTVLAFGILGPSFFILREVSVLYTLISAILFFILFYKLLGLRSAFIGTLIFITTPIIVIQSHLALENIAPVPFILLWLISLNEYRVTRQKKYLIFSSLALTISFFTYNGTRLITPILVLSSLIYILYLNKFKDLKNVSLEIFFSIICYIPILLITPFINTHYSGALLANNNPILPSSYLEFFSGFLSNFDLSFLYITGDSTPYHSTSKAGMFLLFTLPLFIYGIYKAIRSKNSFLIFILICFFISPLLFGLTGVSHRASRLLAIVPFYVLITTVGLEELIVIRVKFKKVLLIFIVVLLALNFLDFINDYWFYYPLRSKDTFWSNSHLAFPELKKQADLYNRKPAIQDGVYIKEEIAAKFFEKVYFPNSLTQWNLSQNIKEGYIILGNTNLTNLKKIGYREYPISSTLYSTYIK